MMAGCRVPQVSPVLRDLGVATSNVSAAISEAELAGSDAKKSTAIM
jgi:hypothetical protein